jgi:hypothetical protein
MDVWPTSALVGGILIAALAFSAMAASANERSVQPENMRAFLLVRRRAVAAGTRGAKLNRCSGDTSSERTEPFAARGFWCLWACEVPCWLRARASVYLQA